MIRACFQNPFTLEIAVEMNREIRKTREKKEPKWNLARPKHFTCRVNDSFPKNFCSFACFAYFAVSTAEFRFKAAEQRTIIAHGATVGNVRPNSFSPGTGRQTKHVVLLPPHPGLQWLANRKPTAAPWATLISPLRGYPFQF